MDFNNCTNVSNISISVDEYLQSLQDRTTITIIPAVVILSVFAVSGLIGNSLVLFVYSQKFRLNPTRILLLIIACFDLVANVGAIPSEINVLFHHWTFNNPAVCKLKVFLNVFTTVGGAITLLAVAVVRYRKVCTPYGWQITNKQAKIIGGLMAILVTIFSIPYIILYGRTSKETPCYKIKGYECYTDDIYKYTMWPLINNGIFVLLYFLCVVPLIVLYTFIGITARKHSKVHGIYQKGSKMKDSDISTTPRPSLSVGLINSQASSAQTQPVINLKVHCLIYDQKCSEDSTRNGTESEPPVNINARSLMTNSHSTETIETPEPLSPEVQMHLGKTGAQLIVASAEVLESKSLILSESSEECKPTGSIVKDLENVINVSSKEMKERLFSESKDTAMFHLEDCSNSTSNSCNQDSLKNVTTKYFNQDSVVCGAHLVTSTQLNTERHGVRRKSLSHITAMLIAISSIYAVSYLSFLILTLYKNLFPHEYNNLNIVELSLYHLFLRMYFVNSAANPVIYNLCDANFRRECLCLLKWKSRRQM